MDLCTMDKATYIIIIYIYIIYNIPVVKIEVEGVQRREDRQ